MAIYRLIALLADLNTLSCVNSQVYQAPGVVMAKITFHFSPFSDYFCPCHAQQRGIPPRYRGGYPLKMAKRGGSSPLFAWLCLWLSVLMLRLLVLSCDYGFASALLRHRLGLRLLLPLARLGVWLWLPSALPLPCWSSSALLPLDNHRQ